MKFDQESSELFWQCECYAQLLHRLMEHDVFIFNPLTGQTHILNRVSWRMLSACADMPRSNGFLLDLMTEEPSGLNKQQLEDSLQGHLGQLQQLELLQANA